MASEVIRLCKSNGIFMVAVESCTGGGLINCLTNVPGASEVIKESYVTYSNDAKIALGVPLDTIEKHTVYSLEVAEAMARAGITRSVCANLGVGITGSLSRVDPVNNNSVPGEVYVAVLYKGFVNRQKFLIEDVQEREFSKQIIVDKTLSMILDSIKSQSF